MLESQDKNLPIFLIQKIRKIFPWPSSSVCYFRHRYAYHYQKQSHPSRLQPRRPCHEQDRRVCGSPQPSHRSRPPLGNQRTLGILQPITHGWLCLAQPLQQPHLPQLAPLPSQYRRFLQPNHSTRSSPSIPKLPQAYRQQAWPCMEKPHAKDRIRTHTLPLLRHNHLRTTRILYLHLHLPKASHLKDHPQQDAQRSATPMQTLQNLHHPFGIDIT